MRGTVFVLFSECRECAIFKSNRRYVRDMRRKQQMRPERIKQTQWIRRKKKQRVVTWARGLLRTGRLTVGRNINLTSTLTLCWREAVQWVVERERECRESSAGKEEGFVWRLIVSSCNWLRLRVVVKEAVSKSNHPIQNPLLLAAEPRTRDNNNIKRFISI
jgi:hypothetical protein